MDVPMETETNNRPCSFKWPWRFAGASVPLAVLALLTAWPLMMIGACSAWLLGAAALVSVLAIVRRCMRQRRDVSSDGSPPATLPKTWQLALAAALTSLLVLFLAFIYMSALTAMRHSSKSSVSAANLKMILSAAETYADRTGTRAADLQDLVAAGICSPKAFFAVFDPEIPESAWNSNRVVYSSYVFALPWRFPCNDPQVMVAYERKPFTPVAAKIGASRVRMVLYGNWRVETLDEQQFRAALQKDQQRRRELGWPTSQPSVPN
jgi:hypothetical protein